MIKARKGNNIILGLSDENINRLRKNQPIKFKLNEIMKEADPSIDVFIITGKTEENMMLTLKQFSEPQNQN